MPDGVGNIVGFYSLRSNRVNMFDLSGLEAIRTANGRRGSMREINQMLSQPAAVPLVATIVHEATHQIAFNCGLQNRFADIPLWLCEGMAVYFEAPDLTSTRGWRGIGRINYPRLATFQDNLSQLARRLTHATAWPTAAACATRKPPPMLTPTPGLSTTI